MNASMSLNPHWNLPHVATPSDPQAEWVRAAAQGDSGAFERLYRAHAGRVLGLCLRLSGGDRARAEQSTQDVFVRAWEKLPEFRGDSAFGTWLHRIAVNTVLGEHRLLRRWVTFEDEGATDACLPEHSASPPELRAQQNMDLERALARLPRGARAVLVLHDVEGYEHAEIAALTGIAVGTSKAQLHRARRLMKEFLQ